MTSSSDAAHTAELVFEYNSQRAATIVADAVSQEVDEIGGDRASATVNRGDRTLYVDIDAADLVALRAGLNTWTTLVEVAERALEAGQR